MLKPVIVNHSTSFPNNLHKLFTNADIINYKHFNAQQIETYDYVILSGGEINISGNDDIIDEKQWLKATSKPILGICLGMQILSILEGEILLPIGKRVVNKFKIDVMNLFGDMYYDHGWYISNIPNGYEGKLRDGKLDFIFNKNRLAFQGHPELSGDFGIEIKNLFLSKFI